MRKGKHLGKKGPTLVNLQEKASFYLFYMYKTKYTYSFPNIKVSLHFLLPKLLKNI